MKTKKQNTQQHEEQTFIFEGRRLLIAEADEICPTVKDVIVLETTKDKQWYRCMCLNTKLIDWYDMAERMTVVEDFGTIAIELPARMKSKIII